MFPLADLLLAAAGFLLAATALVGGFRLGRGAKARLPKYPCDCGHSLSMHDPEPGPCYAEGMKVVGYEGGSAVKKLVFCNCQRYIGIGERPRPPEGE